jgi:hypothetical protein
MPVPRPEYPRPRFVRADWLCLNGEWQFEVDAGDSGKDRGLVDRDRKRTVFTTFTAVLSSTLSACAPFRLRVAAIEKVP